MHNIIIKFTLLVYLVSSLHATDYDQTNQVKSFVQRFYVEVLERQPDNAGLDGWTNDLITRRKTGADVANGFIFSEEFITKDKTDEAFITVMYRAFFNRSASEDAEGFTYWLDKLKSGEGKEAVSHGFLYSQEFANLSASYGIQAYEGAPFTTPALDSFVKRFYTVILGRDADSAGLKSWTDKLSTNQATGSDIAFGFILSTEYDMPSKTNTEYLNTLYSAFFNRTADTDGLNAWMSELANGTTREAVLEGFLHSQEFINLTNSFGILAYEGAPVLTPTYVTSISKNAFNVYTEDTFSDSTCSALAIEIPIGIFASPNGNMNATGTQEDPLDLQTALLNNNIVQDGDTLWLMEGTYKGTFTSELRGSENQPIKVKPYPGKHVTIDTTNATSGAGLLINGTWTEYYGIEVTSYDGNRVSYVDNSSNPSDITLNAGVSIIGSTNKVINFVSHDNVSGIDAWSKRRDGFTGIDTETYGSIIYNNGWSAQPSDGSYGRGHGHAIYTQNHDGIKKITNNVIFYGFGTGIHAYQTGKVVQDGVLRGIENFDIQDNTWFLTGASDIRKGMKKYDCLVGGYQPVKNLTLKNNQGYSDIGRTMLGYASNYKGVPFYNENALLDHNYLVQNLKLQNNWNDGTIGIKNTSIFHGITGNQDFLNDLGGNTYSAEPTSGKKIFYIKNSYDPRRGRITIFNFDRDARVAVDLSRLMKVGSSYRVHSVFDLYGEPIIKGVYGGGTVDIPMGTVPPPQPYGLEGAINASEGDDPKELFGVFIVTHAGCQ